MKIQPCTSRADAVRRTALAAVIVHRNENGGDTARLTLAREVLAYNAAEATRFGAPSWVGDASLAVVRGDGWAAHDTEGEGVVRELYDAAVDHHETEREIMDRVPAWTPRERPQGA